MLQGKTSFLSVFCHRKFMTIGEHFLQKSHHVPCIMTLSTIPSLSILNIWICWRLTALVVHEGPPPFIYLGSINYSHHNVQLYFFYKEQLRSMLEFNQQWHTNRGWSACGGSKTNLLCSWSQLQHISFHISCFVLTEVNPRNSTEFFFTLTFTLSHNKTWFKLNMTADVS